MPDAGRGSQGDPATAWLAAGTAGQLAEAVPPEHPQVHGLEVDRVAEAVQPGWDLHALG